jgi:dihydroorotate dehydrogenase
MDRYKKFFLKSFLFLFRILPPEFSSKLSLKSIKIIYFLNKSFLKVKSDFSGVKPFYIGNKKLFHPIGLSAGIDKEGKYFNSLGAIGFSFIEVGTFTPLPQKGNKYPRIKRIKDKKSLINKLGFNNPGIFEGIANIKKNKTDFTGALGISIGKNRETSLNDAFKDYVSCLKESYALADYIAVNISSPNTKNLRELTSQAYIEDLCNHIYQESEKLKKTFDKAVPILLKLSPDEKEENLENIISTSVKNGFKGFIISNTMKGNFAGISGGVSGELLKKESLKMLIKVKDLVQNDQIIISSGGISNKDDLEERMDNGADLIQIYTSFVYKGPEALDEMLN